MVVVLITDTTLMPDKKISVVEKEEDDKETVNKILADIMEGPNSVDDADEGELKKTFVNSIITELKMENPPEDFQLNLYMKPTIDIVSYKKNYSFPKYVILSIGGVGNNELWKCQSDI